MKGITMSTIAVELPSGLTGEIRRLKVKDENLLANRRNIKDGSILTKLLNSVWQATTNPGIYNFGDKQFDADLILQGDKFELIRQLRIHSYPGEEHYDFIVMCPGCQDNFEWSIDLRELKTKPLPDEVKAKLTAGELLEFTFPDCGKHIRYRLIVGKDEKHFAKAMKKSKERLSTVQLATQILEIEGVESIATYLDDLSSYDATMFRRDSETNDCGVKTDIGLECPECDHLFEFEVPFGMGFILPNKKKNGT